MTAQHLRNTALLWILALYMVLNYGFMTLRVPPGIPFAEVMLIICLLSSGTFAATARLSRTVFIVPILMWWAVGLTRAALGVPEYGQWAIRDASHVIESTFLIVGFSFASSDAALQRLFSWLPTVLVLATGYSFTYLFADHLRTLSPSVSSPAGYSIPVLGNYQAIPQTVLVAASYVFLFRTRRTPQNRWLNLLALLAVGYCVLFFQSRTTYLQVVALCAIFMVCRRDALARWIRAAVVTVGIAWLLPATGVQLEGRLGQTVSVDFLAEHILSITGESSDATEGAAAGVDLRTGWWFSIYERVVSQPVTLMLGLGYGFPLVDFVAYGRGYSSAGQVVREPHNSFISIAARIGLLGLLAFLWMHVLLLKSWYRCYQYCRASGDGIWTNRLLVLLIYFAFAWILAIGEDAFEKPFVAMPYYFLWGIVLNIFYRIRTRGNDADALLRDRCVGPHST